MVSNVRRLTIPRTREVEVIVYRDHHTDWFWANIVQLPGCFATGRSLHELYDSLEKAVRGFLDDHDTTAAALWDDHIEGVLRFQLSDDDDLTSPFKGGPTSLV